MLWHRTGDPQPLAARTARVPHVWIHLPRLPSLSLEGSPAEPPARAADHPRQPPKTRARLPLCPAQRRAELCTVTHSYQEPPCPPLPRSPRGFRPESLRIYSTSCRRDQERKTLCARDRTTGVHTHAGFISGEMVTSGKKSNRRGKQECAGSHMSARHLPLRPRNRAAHQCWALWGFLLPRSHPDPPRWDPRLAQCGTGGRALKWQHLHVKEKIRRIRAFPSPSQGRLSSLHPPTFLRCWR